MSGRWATVPDEETIEETVRAIKARGISVIVVEKGTDALELIKETISSGSEVMMGSSTTLDQIKFTDYLMKGDHGWKNLKAAVQNEGDEAKRREIRRESVCADYFLGSVNAISRNGELVACDMSGSRVGAYLYAAKNLILVAGVQKITPNLDEAVRRVREYVFPLEDQRSKKAYGVGSAPNKWAIIEGEIARKRITLILARERLGF